LFSLIITEVPCGSADGFGCVGGGHAGFGGGGGGGGGGGCAGFGPKKGPGGLYGIIEKIC